MYERIDPQVHIYFRKISKLQSEINQVPTLQYFSFFAIENNNYYSQYDCFSFE